MKTISKYALCIALVLALACLAFGCTSKPSKDATTSQEVTVAICSINKHGNVVLDITFDEMAAHGFEVGDVLTVCVGDKSYDLPIGTEFNDVDNGNMICRFDNDDQVVMLAINMGSFATAVGIGQKQTIAEEQGYRWDIAIDCVTLSLKQKGGMDAYRALNLVRTNERSDYAHLSDAEYANFRSVTVSGLKPDVIYRSTSPLTTELGRDTQSMAAMQEAGIRSVINLTDSAEIMRAYSTFEGSYYADCTILNPEMGYELGSAEFDQKVRACMEFMLDNDGPYLIHCKEGKDRTGALCAVLECLVGATLDEVKADYMLTYYNFYGVTPEDDRYQIILDNNILKTLQKMYQVDDIAACDLREECVQYLMSIGLSQQAVTALQSKIGA